MRLDLTLLVRPSIGKALADDALCGHFGPSWLPRWSEGGASPPVGTHDIGKPTNGRNIPPSTSALPIRRQLRLIAVSALTRRRRFARIQPNSGHREYSRLSCGVGETQLGWLGVPRTIRTIWSASAVAVLAIWIMEIDVNVHLHPRHDATQVRLSRMACRTAGLLVLRCALDS
jgi:hypothetical protein